MSVSVNATGAEAHTASGTSISYTGITVAAGTNTVLAFEASFANNVSGVTAVWDNGGTNQSMFQVGSVVNGTTAATYIFALRAPTTGNKTLLLSWTTTTESYCSAMAFDGVDQTSNAAAVNNFNSNITSSASPSVTVTSATGNAVFAGIAAGNNLSAQTQTSIFIDNTGVNCYAGQWGSGAASVACGWTQTPSGFVAIAGCNISAAAAASSPANNPPSPPAVRIRSPQIDPQGQKNLGLLTQPVPMGQILM